MEVNYQEFLDVIHHEGSKFVVRSESGRNLGKSTSRAGAERRLAQVEWFKKHPRKAKRRKKQA